MCNNGKILVYFYNGDLLSNLNLNCQMVSLNLNCQMVSLTIIDNCVYINVKEQ